MDDNSGIKGRARELAAQNPPGVALGKFAILLENMFFGAFRVLGWAIGRSWFYAAQVLFVIGLAFCEGYRNGAKAAPKTPSLPQPAAPVPDLVDDDRIMDPYTTPFGVPYGPNVQAFSEPG
jgi:hypothetical protein